MKNKIIMIAIVVILVVVLFFIRVPTGEEFLSTRFFDKDGTEIIIPLSITSPKIEYAKFYLTIENEEDFPITCNTEGFKQKIIPIGKVGIFESELIKPQDLIGLSVNVKCYYELNGQRINLPDKIGALNG